MPIDRKSVEPMAAVTAPGQVAAKHQSLLHFVGNAPWSDAAMLGKVAELVLPAIERSGPVEAWIIDDTGFPKKGRHSVGVTRQDRGQLGKQDNCQVAVTLSLANHEASLPVAYRLYLPEDWAKDQARRDKAKIPETIAFQTKPEIALEQIKAARTAGLPQRCGGHGCRLRQRHEAANGDYRARPELCGRDRSQYLGLATGRWAFASAAWQGYRATTEVLRRDLQHQPIAAKALALRLPAEAWQTITWREGAADWLSSRFARTGVRQIAIPCDRAARRRVAADRVAARRSRADQVLVCHFARGYRLRTFG